jgi:hypothetical protein
MLTLTGCREVAMQVLCDEIWTVRYHWRGRSLLCSGSDGCLGCQIDRPRPVFYVVATVRFGSHASPDRSNIVRGVVELCSSAKIILERAWRIYGKLAGVAVGMRRRSPRQEWTSIESWWKEPGNAIGDAEEIMRALAVVLKVDDPKPEQNFSGWICGAAAMHRGLMRGTQLSFVGAPESAGRG